MNPNYNPGVQGPTEGTSLEALYNKKLAYQQRTGGGYPPGQGQGHGHSSGYYRQYSGAGGYGNGYGYGRGGYDGRYQTGNGYAHGDSSSRSGDSGDDGDVGYIVDDIKQTIKREDGDESLDGMDNESMENDDHTEDDEDDYNESYSKKSNTKKNSKSIGMIGYLKEVLLLWIIYMIMSQNFVRRFIGTYVESILPNSSGDTGILGKAVYGLIMCVTFLILRYFFVYRIA